MRAGGNTSSVAMPTDAAANDAIRAIRTERAAVAGESARPFMTMIATMIGSTNSPAYFVANASPAATADPISHRRSYSEARRLQQYRDSVRKKICMESGCDNVDHSSKVGDSENSDTTTIAGSAPSSVAAQTYTNT